MGKKKFFIHNKLESLAASLVAVNREIVVLQKEIRLAQLDVITGRKLDISKKNYKKVNSIFDVGGKANMLMSGIKHELTVDKEKLLEGKINNSASVLSENLKQLNKSLNTLLKTILFCEKNPPKNKKSI